MTASDLYEAITKSPIHSWMDWVTLFATIDEAAKTKPAVKEAMERIYNQHKAGRDAAENLGRKLKEAA